jgi:mono/diheme cytochrome c family protein
MKSRKLFGLVAATLVYSIAGNAAADERAGDLSAHMHEHWQQITQIQAALIRGDLAAVREPAEYLATHPTPAALPGQWEEYVNEMRAAARAAADAQDFAAAATATSLMGNACGSCHTDNGIEVRFEVTDPPSFESDTVSHMVRHQWAADRMWEGIVGPSEPAWARGVDALLEAPLMPHEMHGGDEQPEKVKKMARRVHQLAGNGMMATDGNEKAEIYGEFLTNCADCHTAIRN